MTLDSVTTAKHVGAGYLPRRFRPDIQGLRAIAVILVVLYHADVPGINGGYVGVDVFFVISGYLITQQLAKELDRTGRISILGFYGRRARRLLPASALVVVTTLVVGRLVLPYSQLESLVKDAMYSAFYGINYHLAVEGVNYQAASTPPSALQHYWSLAVEEQFYVVWPALILICGVLGRRKYRKILIGVAITTIVATSLYVSITTTPTDGSMAYFGLHTRAWELGIGALLALSSVYVARIPDVISRMLGWAGLAAIVASAFIYTDQTPFPGSAALLPVLGSAAVLAAGTRHVAGSLETRLLSDGVMQYIGRASYAWYLWHWPMLILLPAWVGRELNQWERLEVVFLAFWLAVLTYFVENASARSLWRAGKWVVAGLSLSLVMVGAAALVAVLMPNLSGTGGAAQTFTLVKADSSAVQEAINRSFTTDKFPANLKPTLAKAADDSPWEGSKGCFLELKDTELSNCVFGDKGGRKIAVLIGDSHADQWLNTLEIPAKEHGWKIYQMTKAACPVANLQVWNNDLNREYTECGTFQKAREKAMRKLQPDLIIASQADAIGIPRYTPSEWASETSEAIKSLSGENTRAVYVGDSPYTGEEGLGCLEQHVDNATACIYPRVHNKAWTAAYDQMASAMKDNNYGYVDTVDMFCNEKVCPPIVDNMLTHRDQGHVTRTYALWLAPMFAPIFEDGKS
ncbi:MAG: putative acyltransferase [Aeromicrobium sp.]|nr:putative acyltransferase [Aeromicrobium sp.]